MSNIALRPELLHFVPFPQAPPEGQPGHCAHGPSQFIDFAPCIEQPLFAVAVAVGWTVTEVVPSWLLARTFDVEQPAPPGQAPQPPVGHEAQLPHADCNDFVAAGDAVRSAADEPPMNSNSVTMTAAEIHIFSFM
ncbi:hypothetical protein HZB60_00465 [candidate division KSB1 bacterium]|nr:hypothetical protein [candidate division KSB1 bacterium]